VKKLLRRFLLYLGLALVGLGGFQAARFVAYSGKVEYHLKSFERDDPAADLKILFLGDSTAVGTGAKTNSGSVAGYFGQDFPQAKIVNVSRNGLKIGELRRNFPLVNGHYNLLVLQIGANDILRFTPYKEIEKDLSALVDRARMLAATVVILHSGNVGLAPVFSWPFNVIYTGRSRAVRDIYIRTARAKGVFYIDLFAEGKADPFTLDIDRYYAPDYLHPSTDGYRQWYEKIRLTLQHNGVILTGD